MLNDRQLMTKAIDIISFLKSYNDFNIPYKAVYRLQYLYTRLRFQMSFNARRSLSVYLWQYINELDVMPCIDGYNDADHNCGTWNLGKYGLHQMNRRANVRIAQLDKRDSEIAKVKEEYCSGFNTYYGSLVHIQHRQQMLAKIETIMEMYK